MKSKKSKRIIFLYAILFLLFGLCSVFYARNRFVIKKDFIVKDLVGSASTTVRLQVRIKPGNMSTTIDPISFKISGRRENNRVVAQQSFLICLKNRRNKDNGWSISLQSKSKNPNQSIYLSLQDNNMVSKDNQIIKDWPVGIISGIQKQEVVNQPLLIASAQKHYGRGDYCFRPVINFNFLPFDNEIEKLNFIVSVL